MIQFETSLENTRQVPKEVAEWLLERNAKYPDVTFLVDRFATHPTKRAEYDPLVQKYKRSYAHLGTKRGASEVSFLYLAERWSVRIIGSLEPEVRDAIVAHPDIASLDEHSPGIFLERRDEMDEATEYPKEMVTLEPDEQATATFTTTVDAVHEADARFRVANYNNPATATDEPLMTQLANTKDPFEASVLAYKVRVIAELLRQGIFPEQKDGGRVAFGELVPFNDTRVRLDGIAELPDSSLIIVRALATGERMAERELAFWETATTNPSCKEIIFAHASAMHPFDEAFIKLIAKHSAKVKELQINEVA